MKKKYAEDAVSPVEINSRTIIFSCVIPCIFFCFMFLLYMITGYKSLALLSIIGMLPVFVNIILIFPWKSSKKLQKDLENQETQENCNENSKENDAVNKLEAKNENRKKNKKSLLKAKKKSENFYFKNRTAILSIAIILIIALLNVFFFITYSKNAPLKKFNYLIPIFSACFWVLTLVFEKLCKHVSNKEITGKNEDLMESHAYGKSIIRSLRSGFCLASFSGLVVFVATLIKVLNDFDISKYINIALVVIFVYESAFLLISLFVRIIRKEFNVSPELTIPLPGIGGKDLGLLNYLEHNTGMTMRSLWSIKLIWKIIPLSLVSIMVLLWGFSGVVKIEDHQQGAHYRFGKLQPEILQPGLHFKLPYLIDSVEIYDTGVIDKMTIGYSSDENTDNMWTTGHQGEEYKLLLGDGNELVSINLRIEYKIKDLKEYISNSSSPEMLLKATAYEVITENTITTNVKNLLALDRTKLSHELRKDISKRMEKFHTGLEIVSVILQSIHPPVEVAEIYQKIISAGIEAEEIIVNANTQAQKILNKAEIEYTTKVNIEKEFAFKSYSEAQAVITEFLTAVELDNLDPSFYRHYYKYVKALTEAYKKGKLIIVGKGVDKNKVIYIGDTVITGGNNLENN